MQQASKVDITGMEVYTKYRQRNEVISPTPSTFEDLNKKIINCYRLEPNKFEIFYEDDTKGDTVIDNDSKYAEAWYQCTGQGIYLIINEKSVSPGIPKENQSKAHFTPMQPKNAAYPYATLAQAPLHAPNHVSEISMPPPNPYRQSMNINPSQNAMKQINANQPGFTPINNVNNMRQFQPLNMTGGNSPPFQQKNALFNPINIQENSSTSINPQQFNARFTPQTPPTPSTFVPPPSFVPPANFLPQNNQGINPALYNQQTLRNQTLKNNTPGFQQFQANPNQGMHFANINSPAGPSINLPNRNLVNQETLPNQSIRPAPINPPTNPYMTYPKPPSAFSPGYNTEPSQGFMPPQFNMPQNAGTPKINPNPYESLPVRGEAKMNLADFQSLQINGNKCPRCGNEKVVPNKTWRCDGCAGLNSYALKQCPICDRIRGLISSACPHCNEIYKI